MEAARPRCATHPHYPHRPAVERRARTTLLRMPPSFARTSREGSLIPSPLSHCGITDQRSARTDTLSWCIRQGNIREPMCRLRTHVPPSEHHRIQRIYKKPDFQEKCCLRLWPASGQQTVPGLWRLGALAEPSCHENNRKVVWSSLHRHINTSEVCKCSPPACCAPCFESYFNNFSIISPGHTHTHRTRTRQSESTRPAKPSTRPPTDGESGEAAMHQRACCNGISA